MRAMFGLVALLVGIAVLVFVFVKVSGPTLKTGREAQTEVAGLGLQTTEGERYQDMVKLDTIDRNGRATALVVRSIKPNSEFQRKTGLRAGDEIVEVGNQGGLQRVREIDDVELAKGWVVETPRGNWPLKVRRNGKELTLQGGSVIATASAEEPAQTPAAAAPSEPAPAEAAQTPQPAPADAADAAASQAPPAEQPAAAAEPQQPKPAPQPKQQKGRGLHGQLEDIQEKLGGGGNRDE